jgi:formate hydrogenlyase subunit 3/multisubunit Na+/H+ antiporter MnhD subunit
MKTAYYYLFYRIYVVWKKMPGKDRAFSAMTALCLIIGFNLVSLLILIDSHYDIPTNQGKAYILIMIISLFVANYFIFIFNERFKMIEEKFQNESKGKKIASSIGIIFLLLFTVFLGAYLLSK